jgi:hypothetical protein
MWAAMKVIIICSLMGVSSKLMEMRLNKYNLILYVIN